MIKNLKLLCLAIALICSNANAKISQPQLNSENVNKDYYEQFANVFELIDSGYVETPDKKKLVDSALNGMLTSLDPYSSFLTDEDYQDFKNDTKGEFCGIGAEIMYDNQAIKIISPIDDLPAYKAGIKSGDYIIAVDGENVSNLGFFSAVKKMRGEKDTKVILTILNGQDKSVKDVEIIRDVVKINPIKYHLDQDIAYIKIKTFNEATSEELKKAMEAIRAKKAGLAIKGIILDLRNNPGGLLDQAIAVSEYFIPSGIIVSVKGKNELDTRTYSAKRFTQKETETPMVILVNYASASASEIVAAALQENKRALVLGTTTFGKGVVQSVIPIGKDAAVKLTTAKFYTPNGKSIHEKGVVPDIIIEQLLVTEDANELKVKKIIGDYKISSKGSNNSNVSNSNIEASKSNAQENIPADGINQLDKNTKDNIPEQYTKDYQYGRAKDIVTALSFNLFGQNNSK